MGLDEFMKKLIEDESLKYELTDSSSESCWNEISRAISKRQKLSCRLKRKFYKINSIVPLRDIGFAAAVIALCILLPFGINKYKNSMNQYKQNPGTKVDRNKDKNQNKNQDNEKNIDKNNTVDDSQSELEKKLYSIVDGVARNKFNKYVIESHNPYILNNDYDYEFIIHEITDENRIPKNITCTINKDNFSVQTEVHDFSSKYEHVEDLINLVEGYDGFNIFLAYDIPEENTEKIEYYVHQESPDDPDKVFYAYNYDEHTLYRKDNNTGKYKAIYKYELNSNGPMVKNVNADLNGDGINEHVSYDFVSGILSVNNMKMEYTCYTCYGGDYNNALYTIDIDKSDNTKEIVLKDYTPNDIDITHVFYYNNGILDFCGSIYSFKLTIDGNNFIKAKNIRYGFFQTSERDEVFTLDTNHCIKIVPKDFYSLADYGYSENKQQVLTVKKEIPIMKDKNSSEIAATLKVGEKVKFLGTDYNQWVLLENSEGIKGWIEVNGVTVKVLNTFSGNVFDGLFFAG